METLSGSSAQSLFMKPTILFAIACSFANFCIGQQKKINNDTTLLQAIEINAVRASEEYPIAKTTLQKKEIEKNNIGHDLPFLLNQTPSVQVNSDAGNGIGYTGIRIRGIDATRINVTLNGIPYNDAETQGTFFVDLPDISSSANSIQIQRGVGTSTNGAGAFGGTINISTNDIDTNAFISINNSMGSFSTFKNSVQANTGLIKKHFILTGRISNIASDGYVDRSQASLQSYFSSAAYIDNKQSIRINIFSGTEKTHAAWFGIDQATLDTNRTYNPAGTEKVGTPYENQTDNYTQTHYQLFLNRKINNNWKLSIAGFLTKGRGYWEEYFANKTISNYGLSNYFNGHDTIKQTDLINQSWLDNTFYGTVYSAQFKNPKNDVIIGGCYDKYEGNNFGVILRSITPNAIPNNYEWYHVTGNKSDFSLYTKWNYRFNKYWQSFVDVQFRNVAYQINGFKYNPDLVVKNNYNFFNPKLGISYTKGKNRLYASYATVTKEPNRDDYETNLDEAPKPETLHDFELGFEHNNPATHLGINLFYMLYKNQLVLTGKVNDVYAYTRTNIPNSFRAGVELEMNHQLNKWLSCNGNLTISTNKVNNFSEYVDDYDNGGQITSVFNSTDISFSPNVIGAFAINMSPFNNLSISLESKYVGKQFLDNTSNNDRALNDYFTENVHMNFTKNFEKNHSMNIFLKLNNIFSKKYEANGYTYSYQEGGSRTTVNAYYPMATFNFMAGLGFTF